jgi:hypothetical protein
MWSAPRRGLAVWDPVKAEASESMRLRPGSGEVDDLTSSPSRQLKYRAPIGGDLPGRLEIETHRFFRLQGRRKPLTKHSIWQRMLNRFAAVHTSKSRNMPKKGADTMMIAITSHE